MMKLFARIGFLLLLFPLFLQSQEQPINIGEIIKPGFVPHPVLIPKPFVETADAGSSAEELRGTLSADLYYSGLFEILDDTGFPPFTGTVNLAPYKTSRAKYVCLLKVGLAGTQINV